MEENSSLTEKGEIPLTLISYILPTLRTNNEFKFGYNGRVYDFKTVGYNNINWLNLINNAKSKLHLHINRD